ncbi:MAG: DUF4114 domain-containing protein, partial [Planctomycetes bacterium]|nr:DUF4114 domain-containing protein [Planctomycetota bacterium]
SGGGTNFEASFLKCEELFVRQDVEDRDDAEEAGPAEEGEEALAPERRKAVIFLSDGIPTAHGVPRDLADSNITQSAADREATIAAAEELGAATAAELYCYTIVTEDTDDTRFTTLPHCVAVSGGGRHVTVESAAQLDAEMCGESLVEVIEVTVENFTLGTGPVPARLKPGGYFAELVPVATGTGGALRENEILVTATAFRESLSPPPATSESIVLKVVSRARSRNLGFGDVVDAQKAPAPVADMSYLESPMGSRIRDSDLYDFLVGAAAAEFEDAWQLFGLETFTTYDPEGTGAESFEIAVDMAFSEACYKSDIGYIVVDPDDLPASGAEALTDESYQAKVVFHSGDFNQETCDLGSIAAGDARFLVEVPPGEVIVFFLLPNRRLDEYRSLPHRGNQPLFTLSALNPGGFAQTLAFVSDGGRTSPGPALDVVTPGPQLIVAFEDVEIASRKSDQDFSDIVLAVSSGVAPLYPGLLCGN